MARHRDPITAANLAKLSVDASNRLYWNGEQIRMRLQLNWWQALVALLAAVASVATICTGLNNSPSSSAAVVPSCR